MSVSVLWVSGVPMAPGAEQHGPASGPSFSLTEVRLNGVTVANGDLRSVRVPELMRLAEFTIQPGAESELHTRWRYRLEGIDSDWRDAGAWMRITARFEDRNGMVIGGEEEAVSGQSPGWTGDPSTSPRVSHRLRLEVPDNAWRLIVWTCSSGLPGVEWRSGTHSPLKARGLPQILSPHPTVGVHALGDLTATIHPRRPESGASRHAMLGREGHFLDQPQGTPKGWARHGTSMGFARIQPAVDGGPVLILRDESALTFGGWVTAPQMRLAVEDAASVELEWRDAYSIGWAGPAYVSYSYLPAGHYRLRIQPLSLEGGPIGVETVVPVRVVAPFYRSLWFQCVVFIAGTVGVFLITRRVLRLRMFAKVEAMNREKAVAEERLRIARDLHDSLGADLTHLALLSDLSQRHSSGSEEFPSAEIFESARGLTRRVDEIVWALNPAKDVLPGFIEFVANHAQKFLNSAGIRCRLDLPVDPPSVPLLSAARHDLFLAVKESLHNAVKHARASEVRLRMHAEPAFLLVTIEDNGEGIPSEFVPGNGTRSLRARIERLGGELRISVTPGGGTTVSFRVPLQSSI